MSNNLFMKKIGEKAKFASLNLSRLNINKKNSVLRKFSQYLKNNEKLILNANRKDVNEAKSKKIKISMINRLKLDHKKNVSVLAGVNNVELGDKVEITINNKNVSSKAHQ